jgi:hypothetical protein
MNIVEYIRKGGAVVAFIHALEHLLEASLKAVREAVPERRRILLEESPRGMVELFCQILIYVELVQRSLVVRESAVHQRPVLFNLRHLILKCNDTRKYMYIHANEP